MDKYKTSLNCKSICSVYPSSILLAALVRLIGGSPLYTADTVNKLLGHFREDPQLLRLRTSAKEAATVYDKMADDLIIQGIRKAYPDHSVLTEETWLIKGNPGWLWIVDSFYLAEQGSGAYLNQRRIRVSENSSLDQSYLFYCEGGEKDRLRTGEMVGRVYPKVMDLRKLGSAGLETA